MKRGVAVDPLNRGRQLQAWGYQGGFLCALHSPRECVPLDQWFLRGDDLVPSLWGTSGSG